MTTMEDLWKLNLEKGVELEEKAEKQANFLTKAAIYADAALSFKLAKSWRKAAAALCKAANCYKEINKLEEAADMYKQAARIYHAQEAGFCFDQAIELLLEIGNATKAEILCKEAAERYKGEGDYERSLHFYALYIHLLDRILNQDVYRRWVLGTTKSEFTSVANRLKWQNALMQTKMALTKFLFSPMDLVRSLFIKCLVGEYKEKSKA